MLDFRVKTFLSVCRLMNYTHAARELSLTQSAVSQHMAALEKHYGAKLVSFEGKSMSLTEEGVELQRVFQSLAHDELLLERRIRAISSQSALRLNVGATLTAGEYLVAPPLARYMAAHPEMKASIVSRSTAELLDAMEPDDAADLVGELPQAKAAELLDLMAKGEIDCAFVEGFFEKSELSWDVLCVQELVCVCPPNSSLASRACSMEEVLSAPLIVRERESGSRAVLEHALHQRNYGIDSFAEVMEASSINMIKSFVEEGLGISFVYDAAVRSDIRKGRLGEVFIREVSIQHEISFIRPKGSRFEETFHTLFEGVKEEFDRLA